MRHKLWLEAHCGPSSLQVEPELRAIAAVFPADADFEGEWSSCPTSSQSQTDSSRRRSSRTRCDPALSSPNPLTPASRSSRPPPGHTAMALPPLAPPSPVAQSQDDDGGDLTSLNWLQNLHLAPLSTPPTPPASPPADSGRERKRKKADVELPNINYKQCCVKPPYSYATLIIMAMEDNKNKMTLASIYKWIKENFVYYKSADPSWQNSIRHNLSLNKCFMKVPRSKSEPGKGGFWRLDPEYSSSIINGVFKKRRPPFLRPGYTKRVRQRAPAAAPAPAPILQPRIEPMIRASVWDPTIGQEVEVEGLCFTTDQQTLLAPATLSMIELSPESLPGAEEMTEFSHSELSDASSESPDSLASSLDLSLYAGNVQGGALPAAPLHASDLLALEPAAPGHAPLPGYTPHWEISRALGMLDQSLDLDGLIDMENMVSM